ncbi:valine--tRNA ligase [uncultured Tateyamaria sp.]|uniref:valine--tRNA ligase n=1 Tax=uncultured Tateyamaria sp. TaxID=455651 RepID=UPI00261986BC|nr:valine--tRNA ligase [uncultured Tateyamaria sp.]
MALGKFNAAEVEARIYEQWETRGCFKAGANARDGASAYAIMIPPPNVTGVLHMGHAFNNTLQDIMVRWHRMRGFDTLWQPGTDHAGIATQMVVERRLAEHQQPSRTELGRDAFTAKVWEWKAESGGTIVSQLKRLGASCDWSREAFTMSGAPGAPQDVAKGNFHDAVIKVFVEMYNKGLIYRGKRLVNWDPHFETAISDLEVENIETPGHMWHFKYPLAEGQTYTYVEKDEDGNVTLEEVRDYISIATTRPETMLGDGAVAVHPSDERYAPIVGKLCEIPVGPKAHRRLIPIITDEYPDKDFGSGAVKITGAHDFNDYQVAKRGGIPMYNLMDTKARMRSDGQPYAIEAAIAQEIANGERNFDEAMISAMNLVPDDYRGLDRFEARKKVVADITAEGLAVMHMVPVTDADGNESVEAVPLVENKPIMQPFGDRSKVVIEPLLTDQWFVDTDKIVGPALDAVRSGDVKIMPESGEKVYFHWLENIEPWCISRQLWWGHQIPVWYGPSVTHTENEDGTASDEWDIQNPQHFCAPTHAEALELAVNYYMNSGAMGFLVDEEAANADEALTLTYHEDGQPVRLWRDADVLDTWFSSGLWPIGTLGWPEKTDELARYFPTSDLITGQDILFFWVARMMMMQLAIVDEVPFKNVYLHGLVRDAKGKKMSKSTGNVIDPLDLIDEFGADALRFTNAAMASLGGALKLDTQRIAGYRNFGTKLWNAASFGERNGTFDVPHSGTMPEATLTPNRWIKGEIARTREAVDAALAEYRFNDAASALYAFTWGTFCDWYIELSKPIFEGGTEAEIAETRAVYAWGLDQCLLMLHPIMPFITEELWGQKARPKPLVHGDWPTYSAADLADPSADAELGWVTGAIDAIRSARAQMHVPAGARIPMVVVGLEEGARAAWDANESAFNALARITELNVVDDFPKGTVTLGLAGGRFGLPLDGVIDVAEEIARLEKTLGKLAKEVGGLRGRLKNPKFAQSAPPEVVAETQANLDARAEEEGKLQEALARLQELG